MNTILYYSNVTANQSISQPSVSYPVFNRVAYAPRPSLIGRTFGMIFQGSDDNVNFTDLYTITDTNIPNNVFTTLDINNTVGYRYLRVYMPTNSYGNLAELVFYSGSTRLNGYPGSSYMATPGSYGNDPTLTYTAMFDGDFSTFFDAPTGDPCFVGIDFGDGQPSDKILWDPSMSAERDITFPDMAGFVGVASYTLEFWAKTNGTSGTTYCLLPDDGTNRFLSHIPYSGILYWDSGDINTTGRISTALPSEVVNSWHHYAYRLDSVNNRMSIFLDGKLLAAANYHDLRFPAGGPLFISSSQSKVGEFRYWDTVRTEQQILDNYLSSINGPQPGLRFCFRLDERGAAGHAVTDRSGNNYPGNAS